MMGWVLCWSFGRLNFRTFLRHRLPTHAPYHRTYGKPVTHAHTPLPLICHHIKDQFSPSLIFFVSSSSASLLFSLTFFVTSYSFSSSTTFSYVARAA